MAEDYNDKLAEGKLDLVPMIDCIMLLLLFFILTTKFTAEEKAIATLLPTDKGQSVSTPKKITELPKQVNICIYPEGFTVGFQPSEYQAKLEALHRQVGDILPNAYLRIGGDQPLLIPGATLNLDKGRALPVINAVEDYVNTGLAAREDAAAATRRDQVPVVINCFSGLSWKFAIVVYDGVRNYEKTKSGNLGFSKDPKDWDKAREVDFAPPRVRNYSPKELGEELYDIVNMQ